MALDDIAAQSFDFLTGLPGGPSTAAAQAAAAAQDSGGEPPPQQQPFSAFRPSDIKDAAMLMRDLNGIVRDLPDEAGIRLAFRRVREEVGLGREAMAREVWASFVTLASTRLPELGALRVPPTVFVDETDQARSFDLSARAPSRRPAPLPQAPSIAVVEGDEERPLDWFREDLFFAEHHRWWHVVYPSFDQPRLDRHGELFLYMHQQMLARYVTERRTAGMPDLIPRADATSSVRWGYDPDARAPTVAYYTARDENQAPMDDNLQYAEQLMEITATLEADIDAGRFLGTGDAPALDVNTLGGVLESNAAFRDLPWVAGRADLHNYGHGVLADLSPAVMVGPRRISGIMGTPALAPQDHVFWEWHAQIDAIAERWRKSAGPRPVEQPEGVTVRSGGDAFSSPDILLMTFDDLRRAGVDPDSTTDAELDAAANAWFGGDQWDRVFAAGEAGTTDTLRTFMVEGVFRVPGQDSDLPFRRQHLNHDRFATLVRVENTTDRERRVTIRIHAALAELASDRRSWIEMDRIPMTLPPSSRRVVPRLGDRASVVRKSHGKALWPYPFGTFAQHRDQATVPIGPSRMPDEYCECGWPFSLYLPRGTAEGSAFIMAVTVSEDDALDLERNGECGSRSFCGKRDPKYPDVKPMGYPFNRDWADAQGGPLSIEQGLESLAGIAARRFTIVHDGLQELVDPQA